jgi:hypothetical protein
VTFNLAWVLAWILGSRGLLSRRRAALFPLWFLGIAALGNGIAHPLLALRHNGYFPGVITAPAVAVAGLLLLRRLWHATSPQSPG